ncbi:MAG: protein-glutamate O-methyltransferase CheR [Spirochaetales bacterium]|nr:protein-glutamate O-methyltransferase CheR [Spirochaetales bacterium]
MANNVGSSLKKIGDKEFKLLSNYIESEVGIKLPPIKRSLLESRLQKRLKFHNIPDFSHYCDFVFESPQGVQEVIEMIDAITTNKTEFMREPGHFEFMVKVALPELVSKKNDIKLWSAACSSGQEPYNMAMFMEEFIEKNKPVRYRVDATDISKSSLAKAQKAVYNMADIDMVSLDFKKKYFLKSKSKDNPEVRIKPNIRKNVSFKPINLIKDNYDISERYDIVFCRNVLIYFNKENQYKVISRIVDQMNYGGYLFLGHSESLAGLRENLVTKEASIYRKE